MSVWRRAGSHPSSITGRWLMAFVRNDQDGMTRLHHEPDPEQSRRVLAAAFRAAIRRRFPGDLDLRDVGTFIRSVRQRVPRIEFRLIDAEALVRQAHGEDLDVSGIDADTRYLISMMLFGEVVWAAGLSDAEVAAMLVSAESVAGGERSVWCREHRSGGVRPHRGGR
jgi:hypothetical protein